MAYLSWEEWKQQNPQPYDVQAYKQAGDQQYAGMQYDQRPQEWRDEYQRMIDANKQWEAAYYNQVGAGGGRISDLAGLTNPYVNSWNGATRQYEPRGSASNTRTQAEIDSGIGMVGDTGIGSTYNSGTGSVVNGVIQQPQVLPPAGPGGQQGPFGGSGTSSSAGSGGDPFAGFRVEQLDPSRAFVTPGGISELLNPYQQQVRDQTMSDIERQRQLAQMTTDDQANAAKAFGGNRHGVANALTNDAFARESGRQYANLNQQGWNTAATLNQANAGNYLSGRGQDISQNQGFMQGALQQRQQDTGYAMGQTSNLINAFQVGNNLLNSSGNMDWNSLNQGSSAINGPSNQASTTQDGGSTWNNLFGNLLTGISLVYRG